MNGVTGWLLRETLHLLETEEKNDPESIGDLIGEKLRADGCEPNASIMFALAVEDLLTMTYDEEGYR